MYGWVDRWDQKKKLKSSDVGLLAPSVLFVYSALLSLFGMEEDVLLGKAVKGSNFEGSLTFA